MTMPVTQCLLQLHEEHHALEDYQGGVPRWCSGCGDNAILAAVQRMYFPVERDVPTGSIDVRQLRMALADRA